LNYLPVAAQHVAIVHQLKINIKQQQLKTSFPAERSPSHCITDKVFETHQNPLAPFQQG